MDAPRTISELRKSSSLALTSVFFVALTFACDSNGASGQPSVSSKTERVSVQEAKHVGPSEKIANSASGRSKFQEEAFVLQLLAPAKVVAGKENQFKIVLRAQSGYKVNAEYPLKFKFEASPGVEPVKQVVRKEDSKIEKEHAEIPLAIVIKTSGKHRIIGKLSFSVCTEERCLIEKRDLLLEVDAS